MKDRICVYLMNDKAYKLQIRDVYFDGRNKRLLGFDKKNNCMRDVPIERCFFPYFNLFGDKFYFDLRGEIKK